MRKSQIQSSRGAVPQIKISKAGGAEETSCRSRAGARAAWPPFRAYQLGSAHQGWSPKCEQVVGININVVRANQGESNCSHLCTVPQTFSFQSPLQVPAPSTTSSMIIASIKRHSAARREKKKERGSARTCN